MDFSQLKEFIIHWSRSRKPHLFTAATVCRFLLVEKRDTSDNYPSYRRVLRALHALEDLDVMSSYNTRNNDTVWWLSERVVAPPLS